MYLNENIKCNKKGEKSVARGAHFLSKFLNHIIDWMVVSIKKSNGKALSYNEN